MTEITDNLNFCQKYSYACKKRHFRRIYCDILQKNIGVQYLQTKEGGYYICRWNFQKKYTATM